MDHRLSDFSEGGEVIAAVGAYMSLDELLRTQKKLDLHCQSAAKEIKALLQNPDGD